MRKEEPIPLLSTTNKCGSTCLAPYVILNSIRLEVSPSPKPIANKWPKKSPEKYSKSKHITKKIAFKWRAIKFLRSFFA